jgi:hypothetical protein
MKRLARLAHAFSKKRENFGRDSHSECRREECFRSRGTGAEARVAQEQAKLNGEQQSVRLLTAALASNREGAAELDMAHGGTVVEVLAHPGESVEAGQSLLKLARFDKLLARVDVPAGEMVASGLTSASIVPLGFDDKPLKGERVGFAASVAPKTQGQPFVFCVADSSGEPGLPLREPLAFIPIMCSLAALAMTTIVLTVNGVVREADEGTAAHLFQLLMVASLIASVAFVIRWLDRDPWQTLRILAIQIVAAAKHQTES